MVSSTYSEGPKRDHEFAKRAHPSLLVSLHHHYTSFNFKYNSYTFLLILRVCWKRIFKKCSMLIPTQIQIPQIKNKGTEAQRGKLGCPPSKQRMRMPSPCGLLVYHAASTHSQILTQVPLWTSRKSHSLEKGSCRKTHSGGTKDQTSGGWAQRGKTEAADG